MSHSIYIIDMERLKLPRPYTIALLWNQIQKFRDEPAQVNLRYVELASRLLEDFPTREMLAQRGEDERDSVWINSPLNQARQVTHAVWHMDLPREHGLQVLARLVRYGIQLGLTIYEDQLGLGFLPGGGVLPPERNDEWQAVQEETESGDHPTKEQMRRKMRELFATRLATHQFVPIDAPTGKSFDGLYRRQDGDGWQAVGLLVENRYDSFSCMVRIRGRSNTVRAVHDAVFATEPTAFGLPVADYELDLNVVGWPNHTRFKIDEDSEIEELFDWLINKAMPILDRCRTVAGLNWLMHGPEMEFLGRHMRKREYTSLICAWLTGDPSFDERVQWFTQHEAEEAQRPNGRPVGRLAGLLEHLRNLPR